MNAPGVHRSRKGGNPLTKLHIGGKMAVSLALAISLASHKFRDERGCDPGRRRGPRKGEIAIRDSPWNCLYLGIMLSLLPSPLI